MSVITLFNGLTGESTKVDAGGSGGGSSRSKAWLDEVPRWVKEAVEPEVLKGLGLGVLANYPVFLDGRGRTSNAIGTNAPIAVFNGARVWKVRRHTVQVGTGDAAELDFGNEALTQPDPTLADYGNTGSDGLSPVAPRGGAAPAFVLSNTDGGGFDLSMTDGILTVIVDGTSFNINVGIGTTTTVELLRNSIVDSGVPVQAYAQAGTHLILLSVGIGPSHTISVGRAAGSAGAVIFPAAAATVRQGHGSPLNSIEAVTDGLRPQRRILPGTVTVTAGAVSGSDVILADAADSGTITGTGITGTINYSTGILDVDFTAAPANAAAVNASYKALVPIVLSEQVKVPRSGLEVALTLV